MREIQSSQILIVSTYHHFLHFLCFSSSHVPVSITHLFLADASCTQVVNFCVQKRRTAASLLSACRSANLKRSSFYQNKPVRFSSRTFASSQVGARTNIHLYRRHSSVTILNQGFEKEQHAEGCHAVSDSDNYSRRSKYLQKISDARSKLCFYNQVITKQKS